MAVNLSDHFTYKKLALAVTPPVLMMVFTSIYSIVDGVFISNFAGKTAFAAVNFIMPIINLFGGFGFITGTGGAALIAKTLGEGDGKRANKLFSMIMHFTAIGGLIISLLGVIFIRPLSVALGATPDMLEDCVLYGRIIMGGNVLFMLQVCYQSMLMTAGRPMLAFIITVACGVTNMIGDGLLVGYFKLGLIGAASATVASFGVGVIVPFIFFAVKKSQSTLHYCSSGFDFKAIGKACINGSSELLSNVAASVVGVLYNMQLLKYVGEDGVAAYGVIMYASFIFAAVFFGYAQGVSPLIGFHFGAKNDKELQNLLKKSLIIMAITGLCMTVLALALATPLADLFVGYDASLSALTSNGMRLYGLAFLIFGFNIFASGFFTALNNGAISALISGLRLMLFKIAAVLVMPIFLGLNGIWLADLVAECLSLIVSVVCLLSLNKKYSYFPKKLNT